MENSIHRVISTVSTLSSKILSDKVEKADTAKAAGSNKTIASNKNHIKYSVNDKDKIVVEVIRNKTGKIVRTIPLSEQKKLDISG